LLDNNNGATWFGQLLAHVHDVTYDQRSQAFKGFVEQYKTGVAYHGARNGHHLLLTARELAPLVGPPLVKTWERPVDFGVVQRLFGGHCGKLQVFVHGNATNDTSLFGNQLQAQPCRLMRWQLMDGLASKGDGSRGGRKRTRQRFEQRRLARSVTPQQGDHLVLFDVEIDIKKNV